MDDREKRYEFRIDLEVRDYECDMEGIVNNAVYLNYLEHARHQYMKTKGLDFSEIVGQKINLVVTRVEIDYRLSLRSGDTFWIGLNGRRRSRVRFEFRQDIFLYPDDRPVLSAIVIGTALNEKGKPFMPEEIGKLLE